MREYLHTSRTMAYCAVCNHNYTVVKTPEDARFTLCVALSQLQNNDEAEVRDCGVYTLCEPACREGARPTDRRVQTLLIHYRVRLSPAIAVMSDESTDIRTRNELSICCLLVGFRGMLIDVFVHFLRHSQGDVKAKLAQLQSCSWRVSLRVYSHYCSCIFCYKTFSTFLSQHTSWHHRYFTI